MLRIVHVSALAGLAMAACHAFAQPSIEITEPKPGTLVHPGQRVDVEVVASGAEITTVGVLAPGLMDGTGVLSAPPYKFSFTVDKISLGMNPIGAIGFTSSTQVGAGTTVDIEREDLPQKLAVNHIGIEFKVGDALALDVYGTYADGSIVHLSKST